MNTIFKYEEFPSQEFLSLKEADKFLLDNGEFRKSYQLLKKELDEVFYFNRYCVKLKKTTVCEVCNCIRREVISIVTSQEEVDSIMDQESISWFGKDRTCSNPLCIKFKDSAGGLTFYQWLNFTGIKGRTSEFDILNKLRFFGPDPAWLVRDSDGG